MFYKWRIFSLMLILCATHAARGGWIEDRDGKTIIHVKLFDLPDPSRTDTSTRADAAAVKEFIRRFPRLFAERYRQKYQANPEKYGRHNWDNVEIELHRFSGIQVEGVGSELLAVAGGVAPDVMYVNFRMSDTYIQQGFLYPMDKPDDGYLSAMSQNELDFRVHPQIWPVIRRQGPDKGMQVWAMPYGGALGKVVIYRKDLFDAAGVPYPHPDWTWDDFYSACTNIADPGSGIYGIHFSKGKHESWWWITFLWSAGGEIMTWDEVSGAWTIDFDSPAAAVALDFYNRLCTEEWTDAEGRKRYGYAHRDADWGSTAAKWDRGEIAMMVAYIDEKIFQRINPDITGMAPVPVGPTGQRGAELNSMMMGLFADIKDPAVRDAAWEYIRFYDCEDAARIKTKIMVEGGLGRFINPRYLEKFGYPELVRLAPKGWKECFDIALETGRPEPYGKNSNAIYDLMTRPIETAEELALQGKLPAGREERLMFLQKLLQQSVQKAREEMLGTLPPSTLRIHRLTAMFALAGIFAAFTWGFIRIGKAFTPPKLELHHGESWNPRRTVWAWLLLMPALLTIFLWQYLPLVRGSLMAFQDYQIMGHSRWVGLDNFGSVLWDAQWWSAVWNSVRYCLLVISLTFLPPVILAILLQEIPRGRLLFRTIYYLPAVMSGLVVILLWKTFYDPTERGLLNALLMRIPAAGFLSIGLFIFLLAFSFARRLLYHGRRPWALLFAGAGIFAMYLAAKIATPVFAQAGPWYSKILMTIPEPFRWLGDSHVAMLACVIPLIWAGMGPGCLIYLAALKSVPDELYEAADMDGATFIDKIIFIVFPILKPLLIINLVGAFIGSWLHATANILAMTGGAARTEVAGLHIFYKAFIYLKFGPATAMAWILALILIGFTVYQLRILSRLEFRTTGDKD